MPLFSLPFGETRASLRLSACAASTTTGSASRPLAVVPARLQHAVVLASSCGSTRGRSMATRASYMGDVALINVDFVSPALWLGVLCAFSGLSLYTYKLSNAGGTRDSEIVTASLLGLSGGILAVQGWRLDPILLLSEGVLSGIGIYYVVQTVNLRKQLDATPGSYDDPRQPPALGGYQWPPNALPDDERDPATWPFPDEQEQYASRSGRQTSQDSRAGENGGGTQWSGRRSDGPYDPYGGGTYADAAESRGYLTPGEPRPRVSDSWQQSEGGEDRAARGSSGDDVGRSGAMYGPQADWEGSMQRAPVNGDFEWSLDRSRRSAASEHSGRSRWDDAGDEGTQSGQSGYADRDQSSLSEGASSSSYASEAGQGVSTADSSRGDANSRGDGSTAQYAVDTGAADAVVESEQWWSQSQSAATGQDDDNRDKWGSPRNRSDRDAEWR